MDRPAVDDGEDHEDGEGGQQVVDDLMRRLVVNDELHHGLEHGHSAHEQGHQEEEVRRGGVDLEVALHEDRDDDLRVK